MTFEHVSYDPIQATEQAPNLSRKCSRRSLIVTLSLTAVLGFIGFRSVKASQGDTVKGIGGFLGLSSDGENSCSQVTTQPNFDLNAFISQSWYIQQQMEINYLPIANNICVEATYTLLNPPKFWGQTIQVRNYAREPDGSFRDTKDLLCASPADPMDAAKLQVGPCFLPKWLGVTTGDYWVIAYDEAQGYALISGGQPYIEGTNGCKTGTGTNGSGLWIFTRQQVRNEALVQQVRAIAFQQGFDLSVLNDVDNSNCVAPPVDESGGSFSNA